MIASASGPSISNGRATKQPKGIRAQPANRSRRPVDQLLPEAVVEQLHRSMTQKVAITPALVTRLDRRFHIAEQYGVSKRRLHTYLQRVRANDKPANQSTTRTTRHGEPSDDRSPWRDKVHAHRRRQVSVAAILDQTFGHLAGCNPDLWERRAYLMLIGSVYERLATTEHEISNEELVSLAKVLAENRRAESRLHPHRHPSHQSPSDSAGTSELPKQFADVVRQVYGTNFQMPTDQNEKADP